MLPLTLLFATELFTTTVAFQAEQAQISEPVPATQPVAATTTPSSAVTPAPRREIGLEERARILMARKQFREAIEMYQKAGDSAIILNQIGIAYHQLSELDTAMKYYQRAIKKDSKFAEAINNLGTIYYTKKSYRRAINEYKKVLRIKPEAASTWANLANAYFQRKQFDMASQAVEKALALDPHVLDTHGGSGSIVQERDVEDRAKYHYYLAKTFAKQGRNAEALIYIRKALEEGFKEKEKFQKEPEFAGLQSDPEFQQVMAMEIKAL